uniref:Family with sequence similarity 110 member A n=1 Tax=Poecilia mexicana TaxID=48701 RepID=A0A3B3Y4G5_9TELE
NILNLSAVGVSPPRLRPKGPLGPDFYRRAQSGASAPRQSAVERLEADKAKYVKSQVALSKQQPVRAPALKKPLLNPGTPLRPTRKTPTQPSHKPEGVELDVERLSSLISDLPNGPQSPAKPPALKPRPPPPAGTVRRVDKPVPPVAPKPEPSAPASPAITRLSSSSSRKRPSLTRSKSDMSDRFSRAGTELERFFNLCGLEPADLQDLPASSSDIVSLARFRSVSAPGSECGASQRGGEEEEEEEEAPKAADRVPYGVSVIERNARVIKWLYGLRQVKENTTTSTNL